MFDNVRLPVDVETGAKGGPLFQTSVLPLASGQEQRNEDWPDSRQVWDIGYGVNNQTDYNAVRDFFYARHGRAHSFLFKDWSDFSVTGQILGTGDGTLRTFLLFKTYENSGPAPYVRRITRPILSTLNVYVDGVLQTLTTDYVTGAGGWIRFVAGHQPGNTAVVTADFEFDVPVRFDTDVFPLQLAWVEAGEVQSLPVLEVRDPFNAAPLAVNLTNTTTTLAENVSTASHIHVADIDISDDPFGTNTLSLTGADAAAFEIVGTIGLDRTGAALYLKAATALHYLLKSSYHVTVNVDDANIAGGAHPQANVAFTLNITQVNLPPSISLYNLVTVEPSGTSTAAPINVASIEVLDDLLGAHTLSLTGPDAASFQLAGALSSAGTDVATGKTIFHGVTLQTVAGLDYSVQKTFACVVNVTDVGLTGAPQGSTAFSMTFGVVPGTFTDTTPGTRSTTVPSYTTLTIDLWGPGAGAWGLSASGSDGGADTAIPSLGLTAGRGKTSTAGSLIGGAGGVATGGDTNENGKPGANGVNYTQTLSTTGAWSPTGFQFSTSAGGNNGQNLDGAPSVPGPFYTFTFATGTQNVNGGAATAPGGGGAGSLQYGVSSAVVSGGFNTIVTYAKGAPGAGGGAHVRKVYLYGITAGAPTPGASMAYTVGAKGTGGAGYANGGQGADGKLQLTWS